MMHAMGRSDGHIRCFFFGILVQREYGGYVASGVGG